MSKKAFNGPVKMKKRLSSLVRKRSTFLWDIKKHPQLKNNAKWVETYQQIQSEMIG